MQNFTYFFIVFLLIIGIHTFNASISETFNYKISISDEKKHYDVIISINIHENIDFVMKQLANIRDNVKCNYAVILNCNYFMFNECHLIDLPENVYIHDKILKKRTWHGSLTEGIYNNMCFALDHFTFDYFIVSSRQFFGNDMSLEHLQQLFKNGKPEIDKDDIWERKLDKSNWRECFNTWHWPWFADTLLAQYFIKNNIAMYCSPHEGMLFNHAGCQKMHEFLENNYEIKIDLFNYPACVEEFSLQSLSMSVGEPYFYIGNGCYNYELEPNEPGSKPLRFMYKVNRS